MTASDARRFRPQLPKTQTNLPASQASKRSQATASDASVRNNWFATKKRVATMKKKQEQNLVN